jgi:hypothetical protein
MSAEVRGPRSDDRGPHDHLDLAIDRAVREMLDVEPPADLRARVIAEISVAGGSRTAPTLRWVLPLAAAAALIVLAVFVARRTEPLPQAPAVAHGPDVHLPAPVVASSEPRRPDVRPAPAIRPRERLVFAANDDGTTKIAPLKTITPIDVAPIEQERIAPADVAVRPLNTITEIQIAPLTPPDRR